MKKATSFLALLLAALLLCCAAGAESYEAAAMRLLKYSGDVEILDPTGKSRFMMENGRFASGETMQTGSGSMASVSLDSISVSRWTSATCRPVVGSSRT